MDFEIIRILIYPSASNPWFWILVAYSWSRASYYTLDVPMHLVTAADRQPEQYMSDLKLAAVINARQFCDIYRQMGALGIGVACFLLTMITAYGFVYEYSLSLIHI